jgi:diguanylate cyclase (GGDEF)-like protein
MVKTTRHFFAGLGIGPRIVVAFALVFGLMGSVGLLLMKNSLLPTFDSIERRFALDSAKRVVSGFDEQMVAVSALNHDWAFWDELYFHLLRPNKVFEQSNIGSAAMQTSNLNAILLLDRQNKIVGFGARELSGGVMPRAPDMLVPLLRRWVRRPQNPKATECGLAWLQSKLAAVCWTQVVHSDGSGPAAGIVVMARELDAATLAGIAQNAGAAFTLDPSDTGNATEDVQRAPADIWKLPDFHFLAHGDVGVQYSATTITLKYRLEDLEGDPLAWVHMRMERSLMAQAQRVVTDVLFQLAAVALATGLVLLLAVHWWLVRPIARLHADVVALSASRRWDSVLRYDRPDEIGALTQGVNGLLVVLREQVDTLETLSSTDALTGIANRRLFDERLGLELGRLARRAAPLSLLLLDVDHFKLYNDHYGHPKGDSVLQQLGHLLQTCVRQQDLPARLGGEEFAMLLPDTDTAGARALADKVMKALEALNLEHVQSPTAARLTVSIGVATWATLQPGGAAELFAQADKALYAAKHSGRMRTCVYGAPDVPRL